MQRRAFVKGSIALAATSAAGAAQARQKQARDPNFIVIMADDPGAFDLSCCGRTEY